MRDFNLKLLELYISHKDELEEKGVLNKFYEEIKDTYIHRYYFESVEIKKDKEIGINFCDEINKSVYAKRRLFAETYVETKDIEIIIKEEDLKNLKGNKHVLIDYFAEEILLSMDDAELIPEWLWKKMEDTLKEYIPNYFKEKEAEITRAFEKEIYEYDEDIYTHKCNIQSLGQNIEKYDEKITKYEKKLVKKPKEKYEIKIDYLLKKMKDSEEQRAIEIICLEKKTKARDEINERYNKDIELLKNEMSEQLKCLKK